MYLCLDQETALAQYSLAAFRKSIRIHNFLGCWYISKQCSALFGVFGDICQEHSAHATLHSLRAPSKESCSVTLDVSLSSVCDTDCFFRMVCDLMIFLCEGTFAKDRLQHEGCCMTVLRTFVNGSWKSHQAKFPVFKHSGLSCTSSLTAPL